ncbi:hypothetical protein [Qingshengfaniella alkalisoli]|uniref:Uncharacterized protein n=1 Tax=Qingshengfaniella alkalisoli TaxID=2599296 RepID=A0A5B8IUP1_9RHOB|nr:hypothetical protein [Qingshengfaniella alkalisoli]QDY68581.1 hypothetical protein FPZ52_02395 [Qingshengfaniella alkalisoli]
MDDTARHLSQYKTGRRITLIGVSVAAVWIALCLLFLLVLKAGGSWLGVLLTIAVPLGLIFFAVQTAKQAAALRAEASALRVDLARLHEEQRARALKENVDQPGPQPAAAPPVTFASTRDNGTLAPQATMQFAAEESPVVPPLPHPDLVAALHFPESQDDTEGFRALRRALKHHKTGQLVQASQDVLTLLSQDGIYMDDLTPERARPELWRRFAQGERGGSIGAVGGIRDRSSLAICSTRMREDPVFRDAAHHFLRRFDQMLCEVEPDMDDATLARLSDTRTARAFMLLGRVSGIFA